jgi:hypothetical protein
MLTFAYEYPSYYQVIVTDGTEENSFEYQFTKEQNIDISIKESVLLAELEMENRNPIPASI